VEDVASVWNQEKKMDIKQLPNFEKELRGMREAVGEMLSRFRDLHSPIRESQARMPEASKQLRKVNDQTEAAASRVLDVAEALSDRDTVLINKLCDAAKIAETNACTELAGRITDCRELAELNQNDSFAIMEALQFQDITSQQLAHTMDLLHDIEVRMDVLMAMMDGDGEASQRLVNSDAGNTQKSYDPNAEFAVGKSGQADVDSLISSLKSGG
jgi:chemotaxis regulatin CheY-phosphate phosphatase CheZ